MTTLHWLEKVTSSAPAHDVARQYAPVSGLKLTAAAIMGGSVAWLVAAVAETLPAGQSLNALAALAAGVGIPLLWQSMRELATSRALLLGFTALAVMVLAYQSLGAGWAVLGFAWTLALAWVAMDWIEAGVSPVRTGLSVAFAGQALMAFSNV